MQRRSPLVKGGRLYQTESEGDPIDVGTPAWYDWLEHHTAFTFVDRVGTVTVRKSGTDPGDLDWNASCTRQGKRFRVSLGPSHALTLSRLQAAARRLAGKRAPVGSTTQSLAEPAVTLAVAKTAATADSLSSLVRTKLHRPRIGSDVIPRTHLMERLHAALSGPITLVSAPAGFGKTTLLVVCLETIDRPTAWLSLDEHDNELAVFVHSLVAALQTVFPDGLQATASLLKAAQFPPPGRVATLLIADLADVPDDVILVLDDFYLIHSSEVYALLEPLIEHLPPQLHLVLATRSDPPLPLARLRARGHLNDLRGTDLRFTLEETEAFLSRVLGSVLTHEMAVALQERTEGWIAVLRLAALSLRNASDPVAFIERLGSYPTSDVSRYLLEEILAQQALAVQELLLRTSMLEQFSAELCTATLDDDASYEHIQATLYWLEHSNLFLVPLDERRGWYRFHHLFQPFLQQRLQARISHEELATLHRRASAWYATQGLIEQAIGHALAAGDTASAAQLVEARFLWALKQEQWVQMEHWLRLLPEEQIQGSPVLLLASMWILYAHGELKDFPRVLTAAERLFATTGSGASAADDWQFRLLHALIALGWSIFQYFTGQAQASLQRARSALERLPPDEEYIASLALTFVAWSNQACGQEDVALLELTTALQERSTHLPSTARLLFAQAFVYLTAGKLPQLEHIARHLLQIAQQADLTMSYHWAHWLLGVLHYEWNRLDAAVYHFSAVIANQHQAHLWAVQDSLCGLALAYQAKGLGIQAQETARSLLEWVQEQHDMRALMTAYAFQGQLTLMRHEVERAAQWLEMAGDQDVLGPMTFLVDPLITKTRLLLARGDESSMAQGQALLTHLLHHVEAIHNTRKAIQVLALQVWAYDLQGRVIEALEVLERALALARPGEFIRTFADLPQLSKVLQEWRKRRKTSQEGDGKLDAYLLHLLAAMSPRAAHEVSTKEPMRQEGLEPLTERELHILHLLDKNLTNKEMARELVVTPGTVKVHTSNVYRKLSVNNRHAAVALAKALGLLAADQASPPHSRRLPDRFREARAVLAMPHLLQPKGRLAGVVCPLQNLYPFLYPRRNSFLAHLRL